MASPERTVTAIRPSARSGRIRYAIREVLAVAEEARKAGRDLIYLNIGDPLIYDFATPPHIIEATHRAMLAGHNGYAGSYGVPEAVDAIRRSAEKKGIRSVREVYVGTGSSEAIEVALAALCDRGDRVLIPSPGYSLYDAVLHKLEAEPVHYYLDESNGWQPDLDDIERRIDDRTRALVLIDPNNPTGAMCSRETLEGVARLASKHGLLLVADEIYDKLTLDVDSHTSIASLDLDQPVVTFNGLSKAYLAPGFRIGWGVVSGHGPAVTDYLQAIGRLLRARLSANHPEQYAIQPALEGPQDHLVEVRAKLRRRRDLTVERLNAIPGIHCEKPQAAFYAFPSLQVDRPDVEIVADLIRSTGVVVVHGSGFGQKPGTKQFRLVFLPDEPTLGRALDRIADHARKWA